jgi:hypothetical protein
LHVAEAEQRQRRIIGSLEATGYDVNVAQALLGTMLQTLETMRIHLRKIEAELARGKPKS